MTTPINLLDKEDFQFIESFVYIKDSHTTVCGKLEMFDYKELEDKFTFEPFFGECDLFGF
jgi:hypothetical protein